MLPECQNVAVLPHRNGDADGGAAVVSEYGLLRVSVASLHRRDVTKLKKSVVETEIDVFQALFRRELTRDANRDFLFIRVHRPAWLDRVLRLQRLYQLGDVEPHGGEFLS